MKYSKAFYPNLEFRPLMTAMITTGQLIKLDKQRTKRYHNNHTCKGLSEGSRNLLVDPLWVPEAKGRKRPISDPELRSKFAINIKKENQNMWLLTGVYWTHLTPNIF